MSHNFSMLEGSLATFKNVLEFNKPASSLIRQCSFLNRTCNKWTTICRGPPWFISFSNALYEVRVQFYERRPVVLVIEL